MRKGYIVFLLFLNVLSFSVYANDKMTIEEVKESLSVGMSCEAVEGFFETNSIDYVFTTKEEDKNYAPPFPWKAEDAVGYYGAVIRDVKAAWWMLSSQHITIDVEIDSKGKVSQVVVEKAYTGI